VPGGKSSISVIENKVIGYYEAWMARKSCHKIKPTDLPLDALTQ
jgi:chitinase